MATANMSTIRQTLSNFELSGLGIPVLVLLIISMLILPLPPFLLDVLFTFNIVIGLVIIMIAINVSRPLEFSSFPSILLLATMLRLGLNVASTRVVLVNGHEGPRRSRQSHRSVRRVCNRRQLSRWLHYLLYFNNHQFHCG